jgi:hypothetical protein
MLRGKKIKTATVELTSLFYAQKLQDLRKFKEQRGTLSY